MKPTTSLLSTLAENSSAIIATATGGVAVFLVIYAIADAGGVPPVVAIGEAIFITPFIIILAVVIILIYRRGGNAIKDMLDFFSATTKKGAADEKALFQEGNEKLLEIFGTSDLASIETIVTSMYAELEALRAAKSEEVVEVPSLKEIELDDFLTRITRGNSKFPPPALGHIRAIAARDGLGIYQKEVVADEQ